MARLLRLLPDSASPHKPRSVDPSKIAFVSLAAMANQAEPLRGVTPSRRSKVPGGGRSWFTNRALAYVRTPGGPTSRTQRLFRVARSSPNLCARPSLTLPPAPKEQVRSIRILDWCRANGLDYALDVAPNSTLCRHAEALEASAKARFEAAAPRPKELPASALVKVTPNHAKLRFRHRCRPEASSGQRRRFCIRC